MAGEVEASGHTAIRDAQRTLGAKLRTLGEVGLLVFGAKRTRLLTGGEGPDADWPESHLAVVRSDDPEIVVGPASCRGCPSLDGAGASPGYGRRWPALRRTAGGPRPADTAS